MAPQLGTVKVDIIPDGAKAAAAFRQMANHYDALAIQCRRAADDMEALGAEEDKG